MKPEVEQEESQPSVYIPESIHKRLRVKSAETGRPMIELTAEALDEYLDWECILTETGHVYVCTYDN